jgi:hypothetical protein
MTNEELLNTDFGPEIEKLAAEQVQACKDAYNYGCEKLAAEAAEEMDKEEKESKKEDKEEKKEKMDEESEKAAAELGSFIERGFFDGLRKLGSERHNDEFHYLAPYVEQKIAAAGAEKASKIVEAIKGYAKATGKAVDPRTAAKEIAGGVNRLKGAAKGIYGEVGGTGVAHTLSAEERKALAAKGAKAVGMGAARLSPYAAAAGGAGYGIHKATAKKD